MLIPKDREPTTPAELIQEYVIQEYGLTQGQLAQGLKVTRQTVSRLLKGHSKITAEMSIRLATLTGTTPDLWLNCQFSHDLWAAQQTFGDQLRQQISPLVSA